MDRRSLERLRTDRRLIGRKGWLTPDQIEEEARQLPDASDKAAVVEANLEPGAGGEASPPKSGRSAGGFDAL